MTVSTRLAFQKAIDQSDANSDISLVETSYLVDMLRVVKYQDELKLLNKAIEITDQAFEEVSHQVREGIRESEISWNLEKAMRPTDRLGGHIVSGHVDGVGEISKIIKHTDYIEFWVKAPTSLAKYIAHKGSITVDGISLTVNEVSGAEFMLWIIPHTLQETIMSTYKVGTRVNLEVDVIARYLERLMMGDSAASTDTKGIDMAFLAENGFLKR